MAVLRRLCEDNWEIFVNRSPIYCGASPCIDLKTINSDSWAMSSSIVFQPKLRTKGMPEASKLLFVIILVAWFCDICKWVFSLTPQQPHAEQLWQKWGSTIPAYSLSKISKGKMDLACFKTNRFRYLQSCKKLLTFLQTWNLCSQPSSF